MPFTRHVVSITKRINVVKYMILQIISERLREQGVILSADTDQEVLRYVKGMPGVPPIETVRNLVAV